MSDADVLRARRRRVESEWSGVDFDGPVLIPASLPIPIDGTDQFHEFHAHPEFQYLTGVAEPGAALAWEPDAGWTLFAPSLSVEDLVWMSAPPSPEELTSQTGVAQSVDRSELSGWLESRRGRGMALLGSRDIEQRATEYGVKAWSTLEAVVDEDATDRLGRALAELRRSKDSVELDRMTRAVDAAVAGHLAAQRLARNGLTERALQIEMEAEFFRQGGARTAYGSIVGSGPNSAILHGTPGERVMSDGELVLIDAGAEIEGYASDVTRTFPVSAAFTGIQRDLYNVVLAAQQEAIAGAGPGVEYKSLHMQASATIAQGLVDAGILRGSVEDLVAADAHALFFSHGLGHMLGLSTHDCGGYLEGRVPEDRFGLAYLRADLPLAPGYVVTIEPGVYFVPALLNDPVRRERYAEMVDWDVVDGLLDFGGIRIEDDVLITPDGCDVMSDALPSAASEIEAVRRDALGALRG
ncbi:MAG: aminopeptidase P family protein [Chloroflexota bacterium]|nr:aminopeptidase P family protein [Chloroflexota bacterium]MDE2895991.1 aminopeptidase P family protein [Chloroflexota bacterium]